MVFVIFSFSFSSGIVPPVVSVLVVGWAVFYHPSSARVLSSLSFTSFYFAEELQGVRQSLDE